MPPNGPLPTATRFGPRTSAGTMMPDSVMTSGIVKPAGLIKDCGDNVAESNERH